MKLYFSPVVCIMASTKATTLLQFNCNQIDEVRKLFNYEDNGRLMQDVDAFEEWINKQTHFKIKEYGKAIFITIKVNYVTANL